MFSSSAGGKKAPPQVRPAPDGFGVLTDAGSLSRIANLSRRWCKSVRAGSMCPSPFLHARAVHMLTPLVCLSGRQVRVCLLSPLSVQRPCRSASLTVKFTSQLRVALLESPSERQPGREEDDPRLEPGGWRGLFPCRHAQVRLPRHHTCAVLGLLATLAADLGSGTSPGRAHARGPRPRLARATTGRPFPPRRGGPARRSPRRLSTRT